MLAKITGVAVWGTIFVVALIVSLPFIFLEWLMERDSGGHF